MEVVIIEDEKPAARRLKRMLQEQGLVVSQLLSSIKESVKWFGENDHPELIFLDVQLGDGISFEIFEEIDIKSAIIFTTAYDEYALKAFKLNSVDYLLKPIDREELQKAVKKFKREKTQPIIDLNELQKLIGGKQPNYKSRFSIKVGQHIKIFTTDEINCFFSENKGTYLRTITGRDYLMETSLENLEKEIPPPLFFRVNRKFIIGLNAIQDIVHYSNSRLKIKLQNYDCQDIIVSRERVKDFKRWLG